MKPIEFTRSVLPNGIRLLFSPSRRLPLLSLHAFTRAGKDQNPLDFPGTAWITCRLLDEGSENFSWRQLSEQIENAGMTYSAFSEREGSGIGLELRSDQLRLGLSLMAEMLCRPIFPPQRFENEKRKVINHLESIEDDPPLLGSHLLNSSIYQGTPLQFPVLGTKESLERMTVEQVRSFHRVKYAPRNTVVMVVGDVDCAVAEEEVARAFGEWASAEFQNAAPPALHRQAAPVTLSRYLDKEQVTLYLGHLGVTRGNPDYYPLLVMDVILGGGPGLTSRIPRKLREELGLAYSAYSDLTSSAGIHPGRFAAFLSTSPENYRRAEQELLGEIGSLVEFGVTSEEVAVACDYLTGSFVFDFESNASRARFLLGLEMFGLGEDYSERFPELIQAVTPEDVSRVAAQYLDTVNYTTVILGPVEGQHPD